MYFKHLVQFLKRDVDFIVIIILVKNYFHSPGDAGHFTRVRLSITENVFWIPYTSKQDTRVLKVPMQVLKGQIY